MKHFMISLLSRFLYTKPPETKEATYPIYHLYTGPDDHSYMEKIKLPYRSKVPVQFFHLQVSPPHSTYDFHNAPQNNYVLTLCGTIEFTTSRGETFTIQKGDILWAQDVDGKGHKWVLLGEEPWIRAYISLA
uniref:Cupin 2 conserved barrel domain-containing protein n=1 Tax=viral metagenome TaxID=1070528 RepID=A0A6C0ICK3_9ZZZZ